MDSARNLKPGTFSQMQDVREHRDWDPFVVWERQVSGSGRTNVATHEQPESDWNPFRVWADHLGGGTRRR